MKTMLVTGAYGFVGRHVSRIAAERGYRVIGIGHGEWIESEWEAWGLSAWHELDVTVASLLAHSEHPDTIIHCAGSGSVGFSVENPAQDFDRTVGTTLNVLEYLRTCSPKTHLVYPSSAAVYGKAQTVPISEGSPLNPVSPYGVHKKIAEQLCRSYGSTFAIRSAIVRIFSAYGPGLRKQLLWDACVKATRGDTSFGGTGRESRDWVSIHDIARLLVLADHHASSEVPTVNGSTGLEATTNQLISTLFAALEIKESPKFTGAPRPGDPDRLVGDCSGAEAWGWKPEKCWQDGVHEYANWYMETCR